MRWLRIFILMAVAAGGSGCSDEDSPEALFEDYLYRLGNITLADAVPELSPPAILPYPGSREVVLAIEEIRIGFGDYFDLADCQLMQLVSERPRYRLCRVRALLSATAKGQDRGQASPRPRSR